MASVSGITPQTFLHVPILPRSQKSFSPYRSAFFSNFHLKERMIHPKFLFGSEKRNWEVRSLLEEVDLIPIRNGESINLKGESGDTSSLVPVGGFGNDGAILSFEGGVGVGDTAVEGFSSSSSSSNQGGNGDDKMADRALNAAVVLAAGTFALTKLLTIDHDYWHGWTLFEILRYAPQHNWSAYEEALKTNPVLAKMLISGVVYSLGDWIAQCYEGKPMFEFDRARMFRSGLVGFSLHGSLSHYYYHFCEAIFPFQDWWVVPAKVAFDQTLWSAFWNSVYFVVVGFLRLESPANMYTEWKATFWPMLSAGWKLWPFAHLITYGLIPVEQRLLWVDMVELVWVTILSTYSNEKSETRNSESSSDQTI